MKQDDEELKLSGTLRQPQHQKTNSFAPTIDGNSPIPAKGKKRTRDNCNLTKSG